MKTRRVVGRAGGVLLLALGGSLVPAVAGPPPTPAEAQLPAIERQIDRLEREMRRLRHSVAVAEPLRAKTAEAALGELRRLRGRLDGWLARRDREPHRRNLGRFLRDLERRLGRFEALLEAPDPEARRASDGSTATLPAKKAGQRQSLAAARRTLSGGGLPNDDCAVPTLIAEGSFSGDTTAAGSDGDSSCGASVAGPDVWFRYVASEAGEVMFNTFGSAFDTVLSLHAGCPGTSANELECNDDAVGLESEVRRYLDEGEEVLVRLGGFAGDYGPFVLTVGRPAAIAGTVVDVQSGHGIEGAWVDVFDEDGYHRGGDSSQPSGAYSVPGLRAGVYFVKAGHPDYQAELYDDVLCIDYCDPTTGTPIPLPLGEVARADFSLVRAGAVEGTITGAASGDPLAGIRVEVYDHHGSWQGSSESGPSGAYSVSGLAAGTYFIRAGSGSGYLGELFDDIECPGYCDVTTGTPVMVVLGATARADFALQLGGSISGRVVDALTGRTIDDAWVQVFDPVGHHVESTDADPTGRYAFIGLAAGVYYVLASQWGYLGQLYDGLDCAAGCDVTGGTPVAVVLGVETAGIDFALVREAAFSGLVVEASIGVPIADVDVEAWNDQGDWVGSGDGDFWGVYVVGGLPAGSFFATTYNSGGYLDELYDDLPCAQGACNPLSGSPIAVAAGMTTTGVDFALELGGWLSGRVSEVAQGSGLGGWVRLWDSGGSQIGDAYLNEGTYSLLGLTTGTYFLTTDVWGSYHDELYDDLPCPAGCAPTAGTPVAVTVGSETAGIDFGLCGPPSLLPHFPPSGDPDAYIDGCRVQIGGTAAPYHPGCPPVVRIHWDWGDGKRSDADLPASHVYDLGHEWVTVGGTAVDAWGGESETVRKQIHLWDCLAPGACGEPEARELFNLTLETTELLQACTTIGLGPGLAIVEPADVTFRAGDSIELRNGLRITGGRASFATDPALLP